MMQQLDQSGSISRKRRFPFPPFCKLVDVIRKCPFKGSKNETGTAGVSQAGQVTSNSCNSPPYQNVPPESVSPELNNKHSKTRVVIGPMDVGSGDRSNEKLWDIYTFHRETWKVKRRFQSLEPLGSGAFGAVCKAWDSENGCHVAIKRMNQPYKSEIHSKRALRELKLLRFFNYDNLLYLVDAYTTALSPHNMIDLYFVMPFLDTDLHQIIQHFAKIDQLRLSDDHIHFFMYQLLRGLKYLHSAKVIHRDLKPSNVAIKTDCSLKIIDYGLSRGTSDDMTGYVQTRWYRAPEVMVDWRKYNPAVDLWSLGCILGEMLLGKPVFPEENSVELLKKQVFICGTPDPNTLADYKSAQAVALIKDSLCGVPRVNFQSFFNASPECADLLDKLLVMNHKDRPTAQESLAHPYFDNLHDECDEKVSAIEFDSSFEDLQTPPGLKQAVFNELQSIIRNGPLLYPEQSVTSSQ